MNKVILVGHLGKDIEVRYTQGGVAVGTLSVATSESWNDKSGQRQEKTEWHRVVVWGKAAESLQDYLLKGKEIYVEGRLQTREWNDKDNNKRFTTEIRSDRIVLLSGGGAGRGDDRAGHDDTRPGRGAGSGGRRGAEPSEPAAADAPDDDIPFAWLLPLIVPAGLGLLTWLTTLPPA